jgi:hypothetical protein
MTVIKQRQPIVSIHLPHDVQADRIACLVTAIYCRAHRDVRSKSGDSIKHRQSALSFLANDPLAESIAEVSNCEHDGAVEAGYEIEHKYFIEINDPHAGGRRGLTDARPIIVLGYIQPLRRNRRGISNVIIVEEPADFAATWRALPTDEWIALDEYRSPSGEIIAGYKGPAGYITEREYARLLSRVPGVPASHVSIARRRAMDDDKDLESSHRQK